MPTPTYTPLANITLGSSAATVTFSSISQAYRDLVLVYDGRNNSANAGIRVRINGDTAANYYWVSAWGDGSTTGSSASVDSYLILSNGGASSLTVNANFIMHLMDYSATDKHKSVLARENQPSGATYNDTSMYAHRWASTSAITSLAISYTSGSIIAGSTLALYGIAA